MNTINFLSSAADGEHKAVDLLIPLIIAPGILKALGDGGGGNSAVSTRQCRPCRGRMKDSTRRETACVAVRVDRALGLDP